MLFNYEPLHGYAVPLYTVMATQFLDYFVRDLGEDQLNYNYREYIDSFRDLIAFHYHKGSVYDTPFWKNAKEISNKKLEGSEWMKICMNKQFSLEGAVQLDDAWTTSPIAHPMFIWEIDQAFKFGYFDHLPQHHLVT